MFDGILIIDKPAGITSHDVVARCRRILKTKKIGHTGTLDPFATGVMVVLVGKATRLAQFLDKDSKTYDAVVRYGFETDTGDCEGAARAAITDYKLHISKDEIEAVLPGFRGDLMQTPPMYSAKKIDGKKLYELARQGIEIERAAVPVTISKLELLTVLLFDEDAKTTDFNVSVTVSAGTYIRVLAEDIGRALGGGAHLAALRRTAAGKFVIDRAVTLERLEELVGEDGVGDFVVSMNDAVDHLPEVSLSDEELAKVKNGMRLRASATFQENQNLRLTSNGELVAIGYFDAAENSVRPRLVLV